MAKPLAVLGLNAAHDSSACLLIEGRIVAAIAEERLSRKKHQPGFPHRAVDYCLQAAQLSVDAVDCIVLNQPPFLEADQELRRRGYRGSLITNPSHHLLHAYYAWGASGFNDTAILVVDGSGYSYGEHLRKGSPMLGPPPPWSDMEEAESMYVVRDGNLELVRKRWALWEACDGYCRFASLGHLYSMASQYIFGHWKHAGKTMGLAPYGDAAAFPKPFVDLNGPEMLIHTDWTDQLPARSSEPAHLDPVCRNLAAKVQAELERAMLHLASDLRCRTGQERLCISGGVGLNSVTNGRILRELPYRELFVTPAANDSGICIGAALFGHHQVTGRMPRLDERHDYRGRPYTREEIQEAVAARSERLRVEVLEDSTSVAAQDLADGLIVGWFEGGSELGPRALGHRSILCDPRTTDLRDRLNATVKFRESFRPFAASVLAEHVQTYFQMPVEDPFMLIVAPVRPERRGDLAGVCHVDGTCRIQTVGSSHYGRFRTLLQAFHGLTGLPVLLNTSFNVRGEPIVESPGDALDCFLASNINVLHMEGLRITKVELSTALDPGALVPFLTSGLSLGTVIASKEGRAQEAEHHVQTRTGHYTPVTAAQLACLGAVDGRNTLREIRAKVGAIADPIAIFEVLQRQGFVSFGFGIARLKREVYLEPHGDRTLVYAPLRNITFAVNAAAAAFLEDLKNGVEEVPDAFRRLFAFVVSLGLTGIDDEEPVTNPDEPFAPTSAYLLLTSSCNLRCQYCFSSGGDRAANLPQAVAMAAIDLIVGNAAKLGEPVKVRFHGGGEPTLRWEVLTETAAYARSEAKKHGLEAVIGLNTNGLLGEAQVKWIAQHVDSIYLSFDGPAEVQDLQRPKRSGGGSCGAVLRTMEGLTRAGRAFAIRSTVTRESCPHLKELVELVAPFKVSGIELEPMTLCGRAYQGGSQAPSAEEFIHGYMAAHERAQALGVKLSYSGSRLSGIASTYCGAAGRNFAVTPEGHCTLCHRVCDPAQPGAEEFIYGAYDEGSKQFVFDVAKIARARRLHCNASEACANCFAKWNCGGGCYAQNQEEAGQMLLRQQNDRCAMTQALTRVELAKRIEKATLLSFGQQLNPS